MFSMCAADFVQLFVFFLLQLTEKGVKGALVELVATALGVELVLADVKVFGKGGYAEKLLAENTDDARAGIGLVQVNHEQGFGVHNVCLVLDQCDGKWHRVIDAYFHLVL
ncbi:hypothetical protein BpHYR1_044463 [Brachionus plicatilis]|uniref:Uncharacterized protein n=1 Tax=Brachionus plicatilis TaxID=10195 RepID=A0A3M7P3X4_BRAPC|nr:hypothetical protein BpHYR1_044463 [Brachionus plicatilis]